MTTLLKALLRTRPSVSEASLQASLHEANRSSLVTWQNLTYTIPYEKNERTLLQDVQGYVKPGKLTALMGASGAGKTTLLNTLAQRINFGVVHGDFLVDGRPLPASFQRSTGFAEQMDVHESTATVREAMRVRISVYDRLPLTLMTHDSSRPNSDSRRRSLWRKNTTTSKPSSDCSKCRISRVLASAFLDLV